MVYVGKVHGFTDGWGFAEAVENDADGAVLVDGELVDATDGAFGEDDFAGDVHFFIFGFGEAVFQDDDFCFATEARAPTPVT